MFRKRALKAVVRFVVVALALIVIAALTCGAYLFWWFRARSAAVERPIFRGVVHKRISSTSPRPFVANFIYIDLREPTVRFLVTPPHTNSLPQMPALTSGDFVAQNNVQLAINANFFHPFHSKTPWDYYPHAGDLAQPLGIVASRGNLYCAQTWVGATLFISESNHVQLGAAPANIWNAIAGDQWLLTNGIPVAVEDRFGPYPRAAAALDWTGRRLILATVDGKQGHFSEGLTLPEFASLLKTHDAHTAINLDGGGSVTLVAQDRNRRAKALNSPIHTRIPGRQRPIVTHLGIFAEPLN